MPKRFEELVKDISETSAEIFNGQHFSQDRPDADPSPGTISTGSYRILSGYDAELGHVEVTEQFVTIIGHDGEPEPRHNIVVGWGEEDEGVVIDLGNKRIDIEDIVLHEMDAVDTAEFVLRALDCVRPNSTPKTPEDDISPIQEMVDMSNAFTDITQTELRLLPIEIASNHPVVHHIVPFLAKGNTLDDETYASIVDQVSREHGITPEQVDQAIDLRKAAFIKRWGDTDFGQRRLSH